MVEIFDGNGVYKYAIDNKVAAFLNKVKEKYLDVDDDYVIIYTGDTGTGKSVIAQRHLYYLDRNLSEKNLCKNSEEFEYNVRKLPRKSAIYVDEGMSLFYRRNAMTSQSKANLGTVDKMRGANHIVALCIPEITKLDLDFISSINCIINCKKRWDKSKVPQQKLSGEYYIYPNLPGLRQDRAVQFYLYKVYKKQLLRGDKPKPRYLPNFFASQKGDHFVDHVWTPIKDYWKIKDEDFNAPVNKQGESDRLSQVVYNTVKKLKLTEIRASEIMEIPVHVINYMKKKQRNHLRESVKLQAPPPKMPKMILEPLQNDTTENM